MKKQIIVITYKRSWRNLWRKKAEVLTCSYELDEDGRVRDALFMPTTEKGNK